MSTISRLKSIENKHDVYRYKAWKIRKLYGNVLSYTLQVNDSGRFMRSLLSNLVNNLTEGIYKTKRKYKHSDKKCEICGIKCKGCECFLEYRNFIVDLMKFKCSCCNKKYQKKFWWKLKETIF